MSQRHYEWQCPRCGSDVVGEAYSVGDFPYPYTAIKNVHSSYHPEFGAGKDWTVEVLCPTCSLVYQFTDGYP